MSRSLATTMEALARAPCLLVMLDYDGTLSPIARAPGEAGPVPGALKVLEQLSSLPQTMVAVISGRALADISDRIPCPAIILFGNHGFECRGLPLDLPIAMDELVARAAVLETELVTGLHGIDGILVENKGPVIAVHYRRADPRRVIDIMNIVRRTARRHEGVSVGKGKKVLELRPDLPVNKGTAVTSLMDNMRTGQGCEPTPIYAGDDITDEDAFASIKQGVTILVSAEDRQTHADHRLRSPEDLVTFLKALEDARRTHLSTARTEKAPPPGCSESLK